MYQYLNQKMDSLEQYFWCNLERFLERTWTGTWFSTWNVTWTRAWTRKRGVAVRTVSLSSETSKMYNDVAIIGDEIINWIVSMLLSSSVPSSLTRNVEPKSVLLSTVTSVIEVNKHLDKIGCIIISEIDINIIKLYQRYNRRRYFQYCCEMNTKYRAWINTD